MAFFKSSALNLNLCLAYIILFPNLGLYDLNISLKKYLHTSISSRSLEKISRYNNLIDYYSGISYFRPEHKVNPDFIRAPILAESACDPRAVSKKKGLASRKYSSQPLGRRPLNSPG